MRAAVTNVNSYKVNAFCVKQRTLKNSDYISVQIFLLCNNLKLEESQIKVPSHYTFCWCAIFLHNGMLINIDVEPFLFHCNRWHK